jgi:ribulose-5-phosphate 4-epimerase/fuculose-1-phosphate aldolase
MKFIVNKTDSDPIRDQSADRIIDEFISNGHHICPNEEVANFVFNLTNIEAPRAYCRKAPEELVVSVVRTNGNIQDLRLAGYTTLVKTLSNLMICIKTGENGNISEIYFLTPEVGFYHYPFDASKAYKSIFPIAGSKLVLGNQITVDLPERFWQENQVTEELKHYGRVLDGLGLLPAPFPIHKVLSQELVDHIFRIYEVKGLSYGNLSVRDHIHEFGEDVFWMTGRGVNKANLRGVGYDILLVTGFDEQSQKVKVSVPPDHDPRVRVSVDALEHDMIYKAFPEIGAIVHVHGWIKDILCTDQNYPCGTLELSEEVIRLLRRTGNPGRTVIGLKNHGISITGPSLKDIFERTEGKILREIPMFE